MRHIHLDGLGLIELAIPDGMEEDFGPGPNDEAASYWGPVVQGLNLTVTSDALLNSLDECMGDLLERDASEETLWQYAAWIAAWNIIEEGDMA